MARVVLSFVSKARLIWLKVGAAGYVLLVWTGIGPALHAAAAETLLAPGISGFTPGSGYPGASVILEGSNLTQVISIEFNGVPAPVYGGVDDGTSVQTEVPEGAVTGPVTVATANGLATSAQDFQVLTAPAPVVTSFTPSSGPAGTWVNFQGSGLVNVTNVAFNGVNAQFSTFVGLAAAVPPNATTGPITVSTAQGTFTTAQDFVVTAIPPPTITSFSPASGYPGVTVTINGSNLTHVTQVSFGGVLSKPVSGFPSQGQLWVTVPEGALSGPIGVITDGGEASSATPFTVTPVPWPVITGLSTTVARPGDWVILTGENLLHPTSVSIRGVAATIHATGQDGLTFVVPFAANGPVRVTTAGGTALSAQILTIVGGPPPPQLLAFSPTNGLVGSSVTLHAQALARVDGVAFNGTAAEFEQRGDDIVVARVPAQGTSGPITVEVSDEILTSSAAFHVFHSGDVEMVTLASLDPSRVPAPVSFSTAMTNLTDTAITALILTNSFTTEAGLIDELLSWTDGSPALKAGVPADAEVLQFNSSQGTGEIIDHSVVFNLGTLAAGESARVTVQLQPRAPLPVLLLSMATALRSNGQPAYSASFASADNGLHISITPFGSSEVQIAYPLSDVPLVLQTADALFPAPNWLNVTAPVTITNGQNTVQLPMGPEPRFYRLVEKK